jgi:hypothetical protein
LWNEVAEKMANLKEGHSWPGKITVSKEVVISISLMGRSRKGFALRV